MGKQCSQPCHQAAALTEGKSGSRLASTERSADTEASDWLVVDCQEQVLYLAAQKEARWHLVAQWPRYHSKPLEYTQEELGRLLDSLQEAASPPDWPVRLAEALRESRANERLLLAWLDARKGVDAHGG